MTLVCCEKCGRQFYTKPNWIEKGWGKYCSRDCVFAKQRKGKVINCFICNKEAYKSPKELIRSKSKKFFCSKSCQTTWRNKIVFIGENHANWKTGESAYRRILAANGKTLICRLCDNLDKRVLIVHHKDRNRENNKIENLVWLCHNCHYLVHHFEDTKDQLRKLGDDMVTVAQK